MSGKIILTADSTCDIGPRLQKKYDVQFFQYHIILGDESYRDGIDIHPPDLYKAWRERGILPKTAAITPVEYAEFFAPWVKQGFDIVHVNLGSGLSSSYQNAMLTAREMGHIYPVDSASLSSGSGHLVAKAGELIASGMSAPQIQQELTSLRTKVSASFVIDTLEFMRAGGRCSAVAAFGANLLKIKPGIVVNNQDGGKMSVGKKYRGSLEKALTEYIKDQLEGRDDLVLDRIFITHAEAQESDIELAKTEIAKYAKFDEIEVTKACSTIAAHSGPRTLGILFVTK